MSHGKVRTDLMYGTKNPDGLVNFKYVVSNEETAIDNGRVVAITTLDTNERDVYIATTPAANSPLSKIALVASPEVIDDERLKALSDFTNEAGSVARGYILHPGSEFSVTSDCLTPVNASTSPAAGQLVELQADTKLKLVASSYTSGSTEVGEVIAVEGDYIVIRVN